MASAAEQLAANMNFEAFQKATELHKRIWFTLMAMVVYRLGCYIPIPGIDAAAFAQAFQGQAKGILGMFNLFSGGAVQRMAIFSLNVMPYISASIIVQLLGKGELKSKINLTVYSATASARAAVEKAGGSLTTTKPEAAAAEG